VQFGSRTTKTSEITSLARAEELAVCLIRVPYNGKECFVRLLGVSASTTSTTVQPVALRTGRGCGNEGTPTASGSARNMSTALNVPLGIEFDVDPQSTHAVAEKWWLEAE
jgi:hypothetical protein